MCFNFRSKSGRTPVNFGRYQRNLFTFSQTCLFFITYQILLGMAYLIFVILNLMEQPVEVLCYFILCYFLCLDLMKSVVLPLVIIATARTRLPQLFSSASSESRGRQFYVRRPVISPRHQVQMAALASQEQLVTCITVTVAECSGRE